MSSENYEISAAERFIREDNEAVFNRRVAGIEQYPVSAALAAGRPLPLGPTLSSAGNLSIGSLYQDVGGLATDAVSALAGGLINGAAGVVAGVSDIIGGIVSLPGQVFGKFAQQPSSPKYGMSERGTTTQGAGTTTSVKQDIAQNTVIPDKLSYPLNQSSRFKFAIQISKYVKPDPLSIPIKDIQADIFLPIPANLVDKFSVDLQEKELGQLSSNITTGLSNLASSTSIADAGNKLDQGAKFITSNIGSIVKDAVFAGALAAAKTAGQARGIDAEALVSTTLGVAINPGTAIMFKGVRLRPDHTFQWRLTPRNSAEADQIKKIIGKLRRNMLPSFDQDSLGMVFNYPFVFNIAILPEDNPFFPKYKTCFLEGMEVNYAPTGPSFHGDNVPTEIDLKLTFQELVIFTANDFDEKTGEYVESGFTPNPDPPVSTPVNRTSIALPDTPIPQNGDDVRSPLRDLPVPQPAAPITLSKNPNDIGRNSSNLLRALSTGQTS